MIHLLLFLGYAVVLIVVSYLQGLESRAVRAALADFHDDVVAHRKAVDDYTVRVEVLRDLLNRMEDQRAKGR